MVHTLITQTEYLMVIYYIHIRIPGGHIILHTLITQTEYLMDILHTTYTYNTNRISDGHILHTLTYTYNTNRISDGHSILRTYTNRISMVIYYIHLRIPKGHIILHTLITQTEYLMVIIYYIHL